MANLWETVSGELCLYEYNIPWIFTWTPDGLPFVMHLKLLRTHLTRIFT
uniref:Uncharacterized protein n=1 Tax=Arundo donax TaxID=35708 RepID=A0A0A8XV77_ARUDO